MELSKYYEQDPLELLNVGSVTARVTSCTSRGDSKVSDLHVCPLGSGAYVSIVHTLAEMYETAEDYENYVREMLDFNRHGITYAIYLDATLVGMFGVTLVDSSLVVANYVSIDEPPFPNLLAGLMTFLNMLSFRYEDINMLLPVRFATQTTFSKGTSDLSGILEDVFSSCGDVVYQRNDDKEFKTVFLPCGESGARSAIGLLSTGLEFCSDSYNLIFNA